MSQPFTRENYSDRGVNAFFVRTAVGAVVPAVVGGAVVAENTFDFFDELDFSAGEIFGLSVIAAVVGMFVGSLLGLKRQDKIYDAAGTYPSESESN